MFSNKSNGLSEKLKIAPTTLPTIAGNVSTASLASLFSASASLFNNLFKTPSFFDGEPPTTPPTPSQESPVRASTIVEIVIERAVNTENMVMSCSQNKIRILFANEVFLSRTFSRVCLIHATCVLRFFRFCDSISNLACFSVFKSSNLSLSLYNCLC